MDHVSILTFIVAATTSWPEGIDLGVGATKSGVEFEKSIENQRRDSWSET